MKPLLCAVAMGQSELVDVLLEDENVDLEKTDDFGVCFDEQLFLYAQTCNSIRHFTWLVTKVPKSLSRGYWRMGISIFLQLSPRACV